MHSTAQPRRWGRVALSAVFLIGLCVLFCAYVYLRIRPEFFYHQSPTLFLLDWRFFTESGFAGRPGGLLEYASTFLRALFAYGWLGALVVTVLCASLCTATRALLARVGGSGGHVLCLVPAVFMVVLLGQYVFPVTLGLGLTVVLLCAAGYTRLADQRTWIRWGVFMVGSALVYYAIGDRFFVLFALLCGIFVLIEERDFRLGAFCLVCAAAGPGLAGVWVSGLRTWDCYAWLMSGQARVEPSAPDWVRATFWKGVVLQSAFLLLYPVMTVGVLWYRRAVGDAVARRPVSWVRRVCLSLALVVVGVGAAVLSFDTRTHHLYHVDCASKERRWADLLEHAARLKPDAYTTGIMNEVNRALYFEGKLLDEMFCHPQVAGVRALMYHRVALPVRTPMRRSNVMFDLGRVSAAEWLACEALQGTGDAPHILQRLVRVYVIKGRPDAARVLLGLLSRSLLYGGWACRFRRQLDADPATAGDPDVVSRLALMPVRAMPISQSVEDLLLELLERNPRNRMAFEYLMACYLLTRQLDKLVANIGRFGDFGHARQPRHCEEAIAIYMATHKGDAPDLAGYAVGPDTRRRCAAFIEAKAHFGENRQAANAVLHREYCDSYFFYHAFGITGGVRFGRSGRPR